MAFIIFAVTLLAAQAVHDGNDPCMLKKHVGSFDRNQDGIIHISETIEGFKALGIGAAEAAASASANPYGSQCIHSPMVENIALAKHTSDSEVYNQDGRFVSQKFEAIFANHARTKSNALNSSEVDELLKANREPGDFKNWHVASAEWKLLYRLGKDADGFLPRENVRNVYDGSFFYQLAKHQWPSRQYKTIR